jgi:Zn-dependent protease/predicted transcriptional regulator
MSGSLRIGSIAGIGIFIHWTFLLLFPWVIFANARAGTAGVAISIAFMLAVFVCIVLHELGHALAARRFGIQTRDITLLPIGGLARLERIPDEPSQELWVAIAGPAVNVVIAGALWLGLTIRGGPVAGAPPDGGGLPAMIGAMGFVRALMAVNIFLVLFNLIPAFPMDGGRVLRAALAYKLDFARATRIAARVGQVLAIAFAFMGLMWNPMLLFIAVFVYLGAQAELQMADVRWGLAGIPVREAMVTRFSFLHDDDTLERASQALLAGSQQDFPVLSGGAFVGVLPRADLLKALAERGPSARVGDAMRRQCATVDENDLLYRVFQSMQERDCPVIPVARQGEVVGIVTLENIGELMMIRSALHKRRARTPAGTSATRGRPATA